MTPEKKESAKQEPVHVKLDSRKIAESVVTDAKKQKVEEEDELAAEGKPELETPEVKPKAVVEVAPKEKVVPLEIRAEVVPALIDASSTEDDYNEIVELYHHVANNPVDAHAPVWTARPPNTTGGYS